MAPAAAPRRNSTPASPENAEATREATPFTILTRASSRRRGVINQPPITTTKDARQNEETKILAAIQTLSSVPSLVQKLQHELQKQSQNIETLKTGQELARQKQEQLIQENAAL